MKYDEHGREIPDPTPIEMPVGFQHPPSLQEEIKRMIRMEMSLEARESGMETFEEADDFEVDDDEMLVSPHELTEMQEEFRLGSDADGPQVRSRGDGKRESSEQDGRSDGVQDGKSGVGADEGGKVRDKTRVDRRGGEFASADGKNELRERESGAARQSERDSGSE